MPKTAAAPTANAPVPKFRAGAMVAAAALEELLVALVPAPDPVAVAVELVLGDELLAVAVKFVGSRWPQAVCSVDLQAAWAWALLGFMTALELQRANSASQMKVGIV
jgi:hypothetical protein